MSRETNTAVAALAMPAAIVPVLYRVEEAAEALRVSRTQVYALIRCGALRTVKIGGSRRVPVAAVGEYVANLGAAA
jgi:excisionase family DNA binding protein